MFTVRLERIRTLSDSTRDFRFRRTDGEITRYEPGQFFRFVMTDQDGEFERSYSLCNFDEDYADLFSDRLDLVISRVEGGRATRLLFNGEEGLEARVTGPFGRLTLPAEVPGRLLLVATSVGLAPYLPILRQLETLNYPEVVLLLGVRDRSEFIYGDQLLAYLRKHSWFDLKLCLSRETAAEHWESDGYVTSALDALSPDPATDHVMLCGNPQMIDDAYGPLKERGFKPRQVIREKYVFAREKKAAKSLSDEQKRLIAEKMKKYS